MTSLGRSLMCERVTPDVVSPPRPPPAEFCSQGFITRSQRLRRSLQQLEASVSQQNLRASLGGVVARRRRWQQEETGTGAAPPSRSSTAAGSRQLFEWVFVCCVQADSEGRMGTRSSLLNPADDCDPSRTSLAYGSRGLYSRKSSTPFAAASKSSGGLSSSRGTSTWSASLTPDTFKKRNTVQ